MQYGCISPQHIEFSMNPDTALFSAVVSFPLQVPSEVSALSRGLHQGLTKQMLTVGGTAGILNHILSNQLEQADRHGSPSALQVGWWQQQP